MKVSNTMRALSLLSTKLETPITVNVIATFDHKDQEFFDLSLCFKGDIDFLNQFKGIKNSIENNGKYYFNVEVNKPNNIETNILEYLRQISSFLSFNLPLKKVHETAFEQEIMKGIK